MIRIQDDFFDNAIPIPEAGCLIWIRATYDNGYGCVWYKGKNRRAHRIAWELTYGHIPHGKFVLHHCDTPACINPRHLFLGTLGDNAIDAYKKKRRIAHLRAKITFEDAINIRKDNRNVSLIAKEYGLQPCTVRNIRANRRWKMLDDRN
jgi:hypothetical protein